jgi:hypothetical protein
LDQNRSQHYNYTHETIPYVFHKNGDDFFKYLEKDGIKFLKFWWKHLEENLGNKILSSAEGLTYQIRYAKEKNGRQVTIALITLPKPQSIGEVFYVICLKYSERKNFLARFFLLRLPSTRIQALQLEGKDDLGNPETGLYELTPRARNIRIRSQAFGTLDEFYNTVLTDLHLERA